MDQSLELKLSLLACVALTGTYVVYDLMTQPSGSHPVGYSLGILGALLMASTETLYSLRKRMNWLKRAGPLRWWLSVHIFTGIVGPFMVLMHTGLKFQGLAGFAMALAILVVASGFFGRYLYNAIPRTLGGAEATIAELESEVKKVQATLAELAGRRSAAVQALVEAEAGHKDSAPGNWLMVLMRAWDEWQSRNGLHRQIRQLEKAGKRKLSDVERLLAQQRRLERQMRTFESARRLMGLWHVIHVPMGLALFGSAAIHIVATFYFGAGPLL